MDLRRTPRPPLSAFVDLFWYLEAAPQHHAKERLLPTGTLELVIPLHEERSRFYDPRDLTRFRDHRGPLLVGAQSGYVVIDAVHTAVMGAHFRPGGAFPFLGVPASEVEDHALSLEDIWGREAGWLREQILAADSPGAKLDVLERTLLARATTLERHPAVAFAISELSGMRRVADVVEQIGLSSRRFIQLFHEQVGLTPKRFSRVRRFQDVIAGIETAAQLVWTDLALNCGYYDQAHFIHDFRNFSGLNPAQYLVERIDRPNHVPL